MPPAVTDSAPAPAKQVNQASRTLLGACVAHMLHDGYTDLIFVLLPVWRSEFALGYGAVATLRGIYAGTMAILQMPSARLAERAGGRPVLVGGTVLAAVGYVLTGLSDGLIGLYAALALSGAGSSTQHPLASAAVSRAYGGGARGQLGTYNFAGDLGKAALPALASVLLTFLSWRSALPLIACLGLIVAVLIHFLIPPFATAPDPPAKRVEAGGRGGFSLLFAIGVLDSGVRMGFLTFLPFLLQGKGAGLPLIGSALTLVFLGGAAGKFACGWLGARFGLLAMVLATEAGTAIVVLTVLALPLVPALALLPLLGVMLNGTSSVLYGTVPELASPGRVERDFALFYTGVIGSGALSPVLYGVLGDFVGADWAVTAAAGVALLTCPLAMLLAPRLQSH